MDDNFSESEIYCNQLLRRKRGFPLYVPGPRQIFHQSTKQEASQSVMLVGLHRKEYLTSSSISTFLRMTQSMHISRRLSPMSQYTSVDILQLDYEPGNYVSTSSIRQLEQLNEFPGGDFIFSCGSPQGAVLALPHGAHLEKLDNLDTLRAYVATHAENWYKYVNGPRGRGLANGSLYLVTGWEKAQSWGMASFHDVREEFPLAFKPTARPTLLSTDGVEPTVT
ncbi:hypothetical protein B0H13DRAFT_2681318 [Mycena leptocephala]|nr:hypothetical protein B0H13DRAFT_2681318 [Mycena leptocephala]